MVPYVVGKAHCLFPVVSAWPPKNECVKKRSRICNDYLRILIVVISRIEIIVMPGETAFQPCGLW